MVIVGAFQRWLDSRVTLLGSRVYITGMEGVMLGLIHGVIKHAQRVGSLYKRQKRVAADN